MGEKQGFNCFRDYPYYLFYCLRDIFEGLKVKGYDCISRMAPADSLIRDLYMVYCPTIPNTIRSDSVSIDFYTMLWVLNSHLNVIDSPQD